MKHKRGRKTGSNIVPIAADSALKFKEKPRAPSTLSPDERVLWDTVVGVHQYDWLSPDQVPILVQYCRHTIEAGFLTDRIADLKAEKNPENFETRYNRLLGMRERETRASIAMARTLRITHQAKFQRTSSHLRPDDGGPYPWETKN